MNLNKNNHVIPIREIDESQITITTTQARPAAKSNEIYHLIIDNVHYICERPKYFFPRLNQDIYTRAFKQESFLIYGKELPFFFDQKGRYWMHEDLGSQQLMAFFIQHPQKYLNIASHKVQTMKSLVSALKEIEKNLTSNNHIKLEQNFNIIINVFLQFYEYHFFTFIIFDELVLRFRNLLHSFLPKSLANTYFCEFLQAEITREAIKHNALGETGTLDRSITYSKTRPIIFYREPKLFFTSSLDNEVLEVLYKQKSEIINEFLALRLIVPISIQLSEEAQYFESKMCCPLMTIVLDQAAELFVKHNIIDEKKEIENMAIEEVHHCFEKTNIKQFLESAYISVGKNMDIGTLQPFDWYQFHPLLAEEWSHLLLQVIDTLKQKNIDEKQIANAVDFVSCNREHLFFELLDMKLAQLSEKDKRKILNFRWNICKQKSKDDIFAFKSNIIRTKAEVDTLLSSLSLIKGRPDDAKLLGRLFNALYNYGPSITMDYYFGFVTENEGPYDVSEQFGEDCILVIKKFWYLKPIELFPHTQHYPYNNITMYYVYKWVRYTSDLISCHSYYEGDVINNLVAYAVEADEKFLSLNEIKEVCEVYSQAAVTSWQYLKSLDFESLKQKALEIRCYGHKKLFDLADIDWKPSEILRNSVRGKVLKDNNFWNMPSNQEQKKEYLLKLYDPFDDELLY